MQAREILNIEDFDPLKVDVSFLRNVNAQLPEEGYMDPAMAEKLATVTLRATEICDDLLGQAVLLLSHRDAQRRSARSKAISNLLSNKVPSTVVKELYADDPDYVEASNKYNIALAWHSWLENKHGTLIKTHHWCKDFVRKSEGSQGISNWETSTNRISSSFDDNEDIPTPSKKAGKAAWNV
jgi:hypothetical protein